MVLLFPLLMSRAVRKLFSAALDPVVACLALKIDRKRRHMDQWCRDMDQRADPMVARRCAGRVRPARMRQAGS